MTVKLIFFCDEERRIIRTGATPDDLAAHVQGLESPVDKFVVRQRKGQDEPLEQIAIVLRDLLVSEGKWAESGSMYVYSDDDNAVTHSVSPPTQDETNGHQKSKSRLVSLKVWTISGESRAFRPLGAAELKSVIDDLIEAGQPLQALRFKGKAATDIVRRAVLDALRGVGLIGEEVAGPNSKRLYFELHERWKLRE